jgi:hypothetical protein
MSRIFYLSNDNLTSSEEGRVICQHVLHLVEAGFDAAVVHFRSGFHMEGFEHRVPLIDGTRGIDFEHDDWVSVPEDMPAALDALRERSISRVLFCRSHEHLFEYLTVERRSEGLDVQSIMVPSISARNFFKHVFNRTTIHVPVAVDPRSFFPSPEKRKIQIAYTPGNGEAMIRQIRGALWHRRPDLRHIPWVSITDKTEAETAEILRQSAVFLSTKNRGFESSSLKAMACGSLVVGFINASSNDHVRGNNGFWVQDEDVFGLAHMLENVLNGLLYKPGEPIWQAIREEASLSADRFCPDNQKRALTGFWNDLLSRTEKPDSSRPVQVLTKEPKQNVEEINLQALELKDPHLAKRLRDMPVPDIISIDQSLDGLPALRIADKEGRAYVIYDRVHLFQKVRRELKGKSFRAEDAALIIGFGLGHHITEIIRRMEMDHEIFVVEPSLDLLKTAMVHHDLRPILHHERVHLFAGTELEGFTEILERHLLHIVAGELQELTLAPLKRAFPDLYQSVEDKIEKILLHLRLNYRFYMGNDILLENILRNAKHLTRVRDTKVLNGINRNLPAVIVSAGPSLNRNIDLLREFQDRILILAVDTALKPLLDRGIRPDLAVSVDPFEVNDQKIKALTCPLDIPLAFDPGVYRRIPERFSGLKFISSSPCELATWILSLAGLGENIGRALSATHQAFCIARAMQSDPIIFMGLDLSFSDNRHHAEGAVFTWAPGEKLESGYVLVPDIYGNTVKTLPGFQAMIGLLETEIAITRSLCIDATEGGALIRGTQVMPLKDALGTFLTERTQPKAPLRNRVRIQENDINIEPIQQGIKTLIHEAETIVQIRQQGMPLLDKVKTAAEAGSLSDPEITRAAAEIQKLDHLLGQMTLFTETLIDFQAELLAFQYLQGYRIRRATDQRASLLLSLESIERAFHDLGRLAEFTLDHLGPSPLQEQGTAYPEHRMEGMTA